MGWQKVQRHQCGYLNCPSCHEYVDAQIHRCFSQRALSPQELRAQKKKENVVEVLALNVGRARLFQPYKPARWTRKP